MNESPKIETRQSEAKVKPKEISVEGDITTEESIKAGLNTIDITIQNKKGIISGTTEKFNGIRHDLGLAGDLTDIPSLEPTRQKISELEARRAKLKKELEVILQQNISFEYKDVIEQIRSSKIDWAHSAELARRLKLKGATDEDIEQVRKLLVSNATDTKISILTRDKFKKAMIILAEMANEDQSALTQGTNSEDVQMAKGVYVSKEKVGKNALTPFEGTIIIPEEWKSMEQFDKLGIDEYLLSHELGHATQDGLLEGELFKKWKPKFKAGAPDPEYVGSIKETDARIRSMFKDLTGLFEPGKERFGRKQLLMLKEKYNKGELSNDTLDLFKHYKVLEIVKMANRLPAI